MKEQNKETFIYIIFWAILITGGVLFMNWWKGDTPANKPQIAQETYEYKCIINDCLHTFVDNGAIIPHVGSDGNYICPTLYLWIGHNCSIAEEYYISIYKQTPDGNLPRWRLCNNPYRGQSNMYGKYQYWVQLDNEAFFINL